MTAMEPEADGLPTGARQYMRLWAQLLLLSWRHLPGLTTATLALRLLSVGTFAAIGLALREVVDGSQRGLVQAALIGAVGAGAAYAADMVLSMVGLNLRLQAVERVGLLELDPEIMREVTSIETLDHLEQPAFLDRVSLLRGAAWGVMDSAWSAVESVLNLVRLALSLAILGAISPLLLVLLLFAAAPMWFDAHGHRAVQRAETATAEDLRVQRQLFTLVTTAGPGKEIRVSAAAPWLIELQRRHWDSAHVRRFRAQLTAALWQAAGWLLFTVGFAAALALLIWRAGDGHGTVGDLVLGITIATSLRGAVHQTVSRASETAGYGRLLQPYLWLRSYAAPRRRQASAEDLLPAPDRLRTGIRIHALSYRYPGSERPALDDISIDIPAGSVVAVVGEYGSGKSTLVRLLCKFHQPDGGAVSVDGQDLSRLRTTEWRARISCAFQDFGRYHTILSETVGLGEPDALQDAARIRKALEAADATGFVDQLPQRENTMLGREFGGADLSEGQWQKLALARACMRDEPLLLVLDEPTASLDAPSELAVFEHYMERARTTGERSGAITIIVSHRFSTVAGADLILVMDQGRLVEAGNHDELLLEGGSYAELYNLTRSSYLGAPPAKKAAKTGERNA